MRAVIRPGIARGSVQAPPSKSMAHRLLICAGLADGTSTIQGVDPSEDVLATLDCLRALGAEVAVNGNAVRIWGLGGTTSSGASRHLPFRGRWQPEGLTDEVVPCLTCRESGSTLRFFIPICLLSDRPVRLTGSDKLMSRPLAAYQDICSERGLSFEMDGRELLVKGPLTFGTFKLSGGVSSQFVSGLLFALPLSEGDSTIRLIPPVESRSYIDMTLLALRDFGVSARWQDETTLFVPGGSRYLPRVAVVEGDWSNAAFFDALNAVGGDVRVTGLRLDSLQGDRVYPAYFEQLAREHAVLDVTDCPDLAPVLLAVAAAKHGCTLTGTRRLQYKESDRGHAMAAELAKFGAKVNVGENEIAVACAELRAPIEPLSSHNDHRVAMALSVLCAHVGGVIDGAEAVRKSFPDYWERLKTLGIDVEISQSSVDS